MHLEIVSACEITLRKSFFEWTVIAKTGSNVSPLHEERFVESAASDVSADRHRAESAAVIALKARKNTVAILLAAFEMKLARKFYGCFSRFGTAGSEIDTATVAKIRRSHRKKS